jgi:molecular chaperone DnaK (HSP70)
MARAFVGIDLGTTHTALAFVEGEEAAEHGTAVASLPVPQRVSRDLVEARVLLPSVLRLDAGGGDGDALPWGATPHSVGEFARAELAVAPGRVVASSKSWLVHRSVDRRAALLPVSADDGVAKVSPVEAARAFFTHLAGAWKNARGTELGDQEVVVTVPASFDAVARELTVEAAREAGLASVTLLEEPQAAFYAWMDRLGDRWRKELRVGDRVLVVDVGGGTTDFSLLRVAEESGNLSLERVAVGDHLLLGGDNVDLALAQVARTKLEAQGKSVEGAQFAALVAQARAAKEALLAEDAPDSFPIAIASRGSKLLGGTLRTELSRDEVAALAVDGFFPLVEASAKPVQRVRSGLAQLGLPYASDSAIARHLAAFLAAHAAGPGATMPTAVLFNGGVFKGAALRARVVELLGRWAEAAGEATPRVLPGEDLDLAVSRGAAAFARARAGRGMRIRGATVMSYYVGIEDAAPAVPGLEPPLHALCIAPRGMEEGSRAALPTESIGVVVGETVQLRFFVSSSRKSDAVGALFEHREGRDDLVELAPLRVRFDSKQVPPGEVVAARFESEVTESGRLVLRARTANGEEFQVDLAVRDAS